MIIEKKGVDLYTYGFELLLSSIIGVLSLILVSVCAGKPLLWLPYLSGFAALRLYGGGYHAKTHKECIFKFTSLYIIFLIFSCYLCKLTYFPVITSFLVSGVTFCFSPVEADNKPLRIEIYQVNRRKSILLSIANLALSLLILDCKLTHNLWVVSYYTGFSFAGLSMIYSIIIKKGRKEDEKCS